MSKRRGSAGRGLAERVFERVLWTSRLLLLAPVAAGVALAVGAIYLATMDVVKFGRILFEYAGSGLGRGSEAARDEAVTAIVKAIDGYLISAILIIFALGLYELFVNRIDAAEQSRTSSQLLFVRSLDDLKDKVVSLILLILAIEFFQRALTVRYGNPVELLYLAGGIFLISAAFYLVRVRNKSDGETADASSQDR